MTPEVAADAQLIACDLLYAFTDERDLGKAVDGEVVLAQIVVAAVVPGRDAGRLNVGRDARGFRLARIVIQVGRPLAEGAVHPRDAEMAHAKRDRTVDRIWRPPIRCRGTGGLWGGLPGQRKRSRQEQGERENGSSHGSKITRQTARRRQ